MSDPITREVFGATDKDLAQPFSLLDLVNDLAADAEELLAASAENRLIGPNTGLKRLDEAIDHTLAPGVHSITGDPGSGKTGLAQQIASRCQFPALYITTEQSAKVILQRHIARETKTPFGDVKRAVPQKIRELGKQAAVAAPMLAILDATRRPAPRHQIITLAQALMKRFVTKRILIVIDALQPWAKGLNDGAEYDQIQFGVATMVAITAELDSPLIALSHRNRLASRDKNATGLNSAKGSADIEHLAEAALHLSTEDKDFDPQSKEPRRVQCHISKNRHGPSGFSLDLFYDGRFHTFTEQPQRFPW